MPEQRDKVRKEIDSLGKVADSLQRTSSTRRMFEQIRVRAAIRLAESLSEPDDVKDVLNEALKRYQEQFSEQDRRIIQDWGMNKNIPVAALSSLRWFSYVPSVFTQAEEVNKAICGTQCPDVTPAWIVCIKDKNCS